MNAFAIYELPLWFQAVAALAVGLSVGVATKQALVDTGALFRFSKRVAVRTSWESVARSTGLGVQKDRRKVAAGPTPNLTALLSQPLDHTPKGGQVQTVRTEAVEYLPRIRRGRLDPGCQSVTWQLRPARGSSIEAVGDRAVELADGLAVPRVVIRRVGPQRGTLTAFLSDPLEHPLAWRRHDLQSALAWGVDEAGQVVSFPLGAGNLLVGGSVGSGKSSIVNSVMASAAVRPDVAVCAVDMKIVELSGWLPRLSYLATDHVQADHLLAAVADEVVRRFRHLEQQGQRRMVHATPDCPWLLIVVDEAAEMVTGIDRGRLLSIARLGRAAGVHLLLSTQRPSVEAVPSDVRDQCGWRVACRLPNPDTAAMVLGREYAHLPVEIPLSTPGVCVTVDDRAPVRRARSWWVDDDDIAALAASTAHLRHDLGWLR